VVDIEAVTDRFLCPTACSSGRMSS